MKKALAYILAGIIGYAGLWLALIGMAENNVAMMLGSCLLCIGSFLLAGYGNSLERNNTK